MSWKPAEAPSIIPRWGPAWLRSFIKWIFKWSLIGSFILLVVALFYLYLAMKYDLDDVAQIPERSIVYDRTGQEFSALHGERRRLITREEIPDVMVKALYAREDARFPEHYGVDVKGLARATVRNIKDGEFTQGASTLTMQLTRNTYELRAKSLHRKFLEIALTLRLEDRYSKDEILTHYLNRIYFGSGCNGVEEAAQTYFGRPAAELNTAECAMLVGIIRGPHVFSPFRNLKRAEDQQDDVFSRMVADQYLTKEELAEANQQHVRLVAKENRNKTNSYAKQSIRRQLDIILADHNIRDGGLKIYSTIDIAAQSQCERALEKRIIGIDNQEEVQAATVKLDASTGGVLAICGGRDIKVSSFNRVYRGKRDLGYAFEPFLHALALERRKVAIKGSSIQTGRQLGVDETIRLCKRIGFSGPFAETEDLYRGALAVTPMELAVAAVILKEGGKKYEPHFIEKITDLNGKVLYEHRASPSKALSSDSTEDTLSNYEILSSSSGLVTATSAARDGWGIRISGNTVTTLWLGFDKPKRLGDQGKVIQATSSILRHL
ncbi:penicillin-binding protein [Akkermansiaceae bacterium]|nr:penicillin-binding protein [Akkermansiaceae bacterium]